MAKRVEITEDDVWSEIDKYFSATKKREDEYTTQDFMNRYHISRTATNRRLLKMVKDGILESRLVYLNHGMGRVYSFAKKGK